jgi:hypothetical protein
MTRCWSCGEVVDDADRYHAACLVQVFGVRALPELDVDTAQLQTLALAMVGRTSISGVQKKLSVRLALVAEAPLPDAMRETYADMLRSRVPPAPNSEG